MDLRFGMPVVDRDNRDAGTLDRVIVQRESRDVTHVVVRVADGGDERLLSLTEVEGSADGRLLLYLAASDLPQHPRYESDGTPSPTPARNVDTRNLPGETVGASSAGPLGLDPESVELGPETRVVTVNSGDGRLVGLGTTALVNSLAQLVLGRPGSPEFVIPVEWIGDLTSSLIKVTEDRTQMRSQDRAA